MRIISGELKGRRLQTPGDNEPIRPTTDRVKEAVFSMAAPY
ncbi:MAG: RsmD family RNA methyltransferase, partial [Eubacteriales bacterium]|nr:RsmD family RNA methyltransferase [Eubacteriales bacterium]MDD3349880.1 RsmD family RNA methyltransferase [Eubacteriales bacterium]